MKVDLRKFKVSRVSVGGLGGCGSVEESKEVVTEVESGEALVGGDEGGFTPSITPLMSLVLLPEPP